MFDVAISYRLGDYLLAMQGLAMLRAWGTDPAAVRAGGDDIATSRGGLDEDPYSAATAIPEFDVAAGYRAWAQTYDSMANFLVDTEETVIHPLLDAIRPGRALDAACGTGRHASRLVGQGHEVVGIDAAEEMLAVARKKVPAATFQAGELEALGLPNASVDLVVCALALTHLAKIDRAIAEFARVLRPEGHLVLSDVFGYRTAHSLVPEGPSFSPRT